MTTPPLFANINFTALADDAAFKEDSVRERLILPLLNALGYGEENIIRSKTLQHPFLKIGSKKRPIKLIPDYTLKLGDRFAWVLDAKAPNQKIVADDNVEQVYCYATHPEIRSNYFVLCNGVALSVFRTADTDKPILYFRLAEIAQYWQALSALLASTNFIAQPQAAFPCVVGQPSFDYATRPLLNEIPVKKQAAKRHFGCNAYFTRQTWNVVRDYINNFSKQGDLVLDPFGGSGITLVEALMSGRNGIHVDLNPLSIFIAKSLIAPASKASLLEALADIKIKYERIEPKTNAEVLRAISNYEQPTNLPLPQNSDVKTVKELFSNRQLAQLSLLKHLIKRIKNQNIKDSLLLAFYNTLTVCNLTFHETPQRKGLGGHHFGFYYRYRMAYSPIELPIIDVFATKVKRIIAGKQEMEYFINEKTVRNAQIQKGTATNLSFIDSESIDYIYTDPPYGKNIPYLDLSVMWNAWLDLNVTETDYEQEAIEGGEHDKTKNDYNQRIAQSIREMYRVLKFDRWLSFVFAHKDPEFWHLITTTAESCGFEYVGAVAQKNGQTSFKKRQHPFTVLSGQLIINFRKVRNPKAILKANLGMDFGKAVMQTIEGVIAKNNGATLEQINNELILTGLEMGFLDLLKKEYSDLTPLLTDNFDYDEETDAFTIRKNRKFKTSVPLELRIKFYLVSYLRRMAREQKNASFDEIVLHIMPLLKNGVTPETQTILTVLTEIGIRVGDGWRIKPSESGLFDAEIV
ncbi:hypothetical protein FACS1894139_04500 [Planctomycetales bacterium]|nr:hypothetical protein FACS1894107_09220 [Planctomycetales bacterium]GHS99075.1 hypothetical protein FACS1894108_08400 [Planctomycetales bacterium]GHT03667.1 hypothetical protein FACS1894139_04500 [Planctomycetales bacterium]